MKKNILIYGTAIGSYRTQNFLKALLETKQFNTFFFNFEQLWRKSSPFFTAYLFLTEFLFVLKCDILIVPAMRHGFTWRYKVARFLGKRVITDFYVSFYDSSVTDAGNVSANSKLGRKYYTQDETALRSSDHTIFLNDEEAFYYSSLVNVRLDEIRHSEIPLCVDHRDIAQTNFAAGKSPQFCVCWWGTYINLHGLDKILEAARIVAQHDANVTFHIFGNSEEKAAPYREMVQRMGLTQCVYIDNSKSFDNGQLEPYLVEYCDLALGIFGDSTKAKTVFPNKIADAFAMGLPVLSMFSGAMNSLLSAEKTEIVICDNTPEDMARAILELKNDPARLNAIGKKATQRYRETFSYPIFKAKVYSLLDKI